MQNQNERQSIQFSLTLGSSHTSLVAAQRSPQDQSTEFEYLKGQERKQGLQILGATRLSNHSAIKKGIVSNMEALSASILEATDEVERQTGLEVNNVIVCVPCLKAGFDNHTEIQTIKGAEIRKSDVDKIHHAVFNHKPPAHYDYVHAIPGSYCVDGKQDINNPIGMRGSEISLNFHRVFMPQTDLHNIARSCFHAGLQVDKFVYEPIAAAEGCLTEDEKEFGCISISIGTFLTHVVVYLNKTPIYTLEIQLGSHFITKDLAIGLRTNQLEAERIKKENGRAFFNPEKDILEKIDIQGIDGSEFLTVTKNDVIKIIAPRTIEILETVHNELKKTNLLSKATKGIVLCGGGALLNGISLAAEKVYGQHARIGSPLFIHGATVGMKSPIWTTSIGAFSEIFQPLPDNLITYRFGEQFYLQRVATKLWQRLKDPFASQG